MKVISHFISSVFFFLLCTTFISGQGNGNLTGQVVDQLDAAVVGASVTIISADGSERVAVSDGRGQFNMRDLPPGIYRVRTTSTNFAAEEIINVEILPGKVKSLTVSLTVAAGIQEKVDIDSNETLSTDPENNAGSTVIKGVDLVALPDDPDELAAALQALAGPASGPHGGEIYIDGFSGGRLPPKEVIREIRINSNPMSAEYDRPGFGRIEILTRPGLDKFRGSTFGTFSDESLNSRNPFASNRAPSQTRFYGGNFSGPIRKRRASYFVDLSNRDLDNNAVVNAVLLDQSLDPVGFSRELRVPNRRFSIGSRLDFAINEKNTLVARFGYERSTLENQGVGSTTLPSRAFSTESNRREIRLTETMFVNPTTVNETRFELSWDRRRLTGDNSVPTITVADAFSGGGSQVGRSFNNANRWELQNFTTTVFSVGKQQHVIKFGGKVRRITVRDRSESNFGGSFLFTSLNTYRSTILRNDVPTLFTVTSGQPEQQVAGLEAGIFILDDWRVNPGLTLSLGLRYENQSNIADNTNFAPRLSFAWDPQYNSVRAGRTIIRAGFGVFYDRISENLTLFAKRFGSGPDSQVSLVINANDTDPVRRAAAINLLRQPVFTVAGVSNVPTPAQILAVLPQSNALRTVADGLRTPITFQGAIGVERKLPLKITAAVFFLTSRTNRFLRSRNINAPVCPQQANCENAARPKTSFGDIYTTESNGKLDQNRMMINLRTGSNFRYSLFGFYSIGFSNSDSDGASTYPAYSYDLTNEYGPQAQDIRHSAVIGGNFTLPRGFSISPMVTAVSGRPFNIARGIDTNGDSVFLERPTFGELAERCSHLRLSAAFCDGVNRDPNAIIPRNYGRGPGAFVVNLRVAKNFGFGGKASGGTMASGGGAGGHGVAGHGAGAPTEGGGDGSRYNLNFSVSVINLLNSANLGPPVGNMASARFGQSIGTAGLAAGFGAGGGSGAANRRVELQTRFSW